MPVVRRILGLALVMVCTLWLAVRQFFELLLGIKLILVRLEFFSRLWLIHFLLLLVQLLVSQQV